jgi:hypothetical protein
MAQEILHNRDLLAEVEMGVHCPLLLSTYLESGPSPPNCSKASCRTWSSSVSTNQELKARVL